MYNFLNKIKNFLYQYKSLKYINKLKKSDYSIVFFSEGDHHWAHFEDLVDYCLSNFNLIYISMNGNDRGLKYFSKTKKKYVSAHISNNILLTFFFKTLKFKLLISSLPDLGKFFFQRHDNNYTKYIYIFHSLASVHAQYFNDSFKYFDEIFCATNYHIREIKFIEEKYNHKKKILIKYGYPRIDNLNKSKDKSKSYFHKKILIALSWGDSMVFKNTIPKLIKFLLDLNYEVTLRPHVQSLINNKKDINKIVNIFTDEKGFIFDSSNSLFDSLLNNYIMIADWGTVSSDFILGLKKPAIFLNTQSKVRNIKFNEIPLSTYEK